MYSLPPGQAQAVITHIGDPQLYNYRSRGGWVNGPTQCVVVAPEAPHCAGGCGCVRPAAGSQLEIQEAVGGGTERGVVQDEGEE